MATDVTAKPAPSFWSSLGSVWPPPLPTTPESRLYAAEPLRPHSIRLCLIDAYGPKIWVRQTHFFETKEGQSAERAYGALREGLSRAMVDIPIIAGITRHGPSGDPRELYLEVPADGWVNFTYHDLTRNPHIPSYAELAAKGFPTTTIGALLLPENTALPIAEGSAMLTVRLNKLRGGVCLAYGFNHVHADALTLLSVEKTWALHTADASAGRKQKHFTSLDDEIRDQYTARLSKPIKGAAPFKDENTIQIPEAISPVNLAWDVDSAAYNSMLIGTLMGLFKSNKKRVPPNFKDLSKGNLGGVIALANVFVSTSRFLSYFTSFIFGSSQGKKPSLWRTKVFIAYLNILHTFKRAAFGSPDTSNDEQWSIWYFSPEALAQLKKDTVPKISAGSYISTNDSLIGLFWARIAAIKQLSRRGFKTSQMVYPVNIRQRLNEKIDDRYFGNILDLTTISCDNKLLEGPNGVAVAAEMNRKGLLNWSQARHDAWLNKAATLPPTQVICPNPVKLLAEGNFAFNDYSRSETNLIDWGKDLGYMTAMRYPRVPAAGGAAASRVHPRLPGGGLEFSVVADPEMFAALQKDEVWSRYAKPICYPA